MLAAVHGTGATGTLPRVGAADRLRSWGRGALRNPWLISGLVVGFLLVCAWIAWAIHVGSEHGGGAALGVLIVWPAIVVVLAVIAVPFDLGRPRDPRKRGLGRRRLRRRGGFGRADGAGVGGHRRLGALPPQAAPRFPQHAPHQAPVSLEEASHRVRVVDPGVELGHPPLALHGWDR